MYIKESIITANPIGNNSVVGEDLVVVKFSNKLLPCTLSVNATGEIRTMLFLKSGRYTISFYLDDIYVSHRYVRVGIIEKLSINKSMDSGQYLQLMGIDSSNLEYGKFIYKNTRQ